MSTWLDHLDRRYTDRVRLLVEILPMLAQEPGFALKGGTAINLFEHDLPRLSVDIDLAWLPVHDYAEDAKLIAGAFGRLADTLRARPLKPQVQTPVGEGGLVNRLVASRGSARVQIETTPVMRGTVHPCEPWSYGRGWRRLSVLPRCGCWRLPTSMPASWRLRCHGSIRVISSMWACCWKMSGPMQTSGEPFSCI